MGWEISGLTDFIADLRALPEHARGDARQVISKGALNIKQQLQAEAAGSRHFGKIARAVSYDLNDRAGSVEAVVGYDKGSPGSLANIAIFGGSRGGGTVPDPMGALEKEAPNTAEHLLALLARHL